MCECYSALEFDPKYPAWNSMNPINEPKTQYYDKINSALLFHQQN